MYRGVIVLSGLLALVTACAGEGSREEAPLAGDDVGTITVDAGADAASAPPADERQCFPPEGVSGSPQSIAEAVALINALPKPTTIPCFVESLDRPLQLRLSKAVVSAQPAVGERSPRIFILSGPLFMSIVPEGTGRPLLEFGELVDEASSLKGEVHFPVEERLEASAPYDRVLQPDGTGTNCGICHGFEMPHPTIDYASAYVSTPFRPSEHELVPLEELRVEWEGCDAQAEPDRCAVLNALFGWGEVREVAFPATMPTIYD